MKKRLSIALFSLLFLVIWEFSSPYLKAQPNWPQVSRPHSAPQILLATAAHRVLTSLPSSTPPSDHEQSQARQKIKILEEILRSKNDNDPRLDTEFNQLTPFAKELMQESYQKLASEARNERGTIIYLLGKNLTQPKDFDFLQTVFQEKSCSSLENCQKEPQNDPTNGSLLPPGQQITLEYPQLTALKAIETQLLKPAQDPPTTLQQMNRVLEEASRAPFPLAKKLAQAIREKYFPL